MTFKFEKLHVWQRSVAHAEKLIQLSHAIPKIYRFSIGDQLRRAALSVPTNIAEGSGRGLVKDQANFYRIAKGPIHEVATILTIMHRLQLIPEEEFKIYYDESNQIAAMLGGLMKPRNLTKR